MWEIAPGLQSSRDVLWAFSAIPWSAPGCCLEAETKSLSWCTEMGSSEDVAVRKHCPAAALEQEGASGHILHGHTKYSCKVPELLTRGHHSSDSSQDCVCQDRWLNSVGKAGAQLSLCTDLCSYKPAGRRLPAWEQSGCSQSLITG